MIGVWGSTLPVFLQLYFVQNKVTEIVALVLGRLKYKMIFLLKAWGSGEKPPCIFRYTCSGKSPSQVSYARAQGH